MCSRRDWDLYRWYGQGWLQSLSVCTYKCSAYVCELSITSKTVINYMAPGLNQYVQSRRTQQTALTGVNQECRRNVACFSLVPFYNLLSVSLFASAN
jgi:hypothetical protein